MIAPDSSVLVAGFVSSHRFHEVATASLAAVIEGGNLIAHTIAESFSVLTSTSGVYRAEPATVRDYLAQFLDGEAIPIRPAAHREALDLLVSAGRPGGAVYDALIGLAARDAAATLLSLDARAQPIYELCGADVQILADVAG